jgi:polyisoprenoid-binding protein YceI
MFTTHASIAIRSPFSTRLWTRVAIVAGLTAASASAFADSPFTGKTGKLTFAVNSDKSEFGFISDAPAERMHGTAKGVGGSFTVADATNAETTSGQVTVPVERMETGNPMRDTHLHGPEWLNAKVFPKIAFDIEKVGNIHNVKAAADKGTADGSAQGTFSMNGVGKKMSVPVQISFLPATGMLKVTTKFKISLKDYNIKGKAGMVGNKVGEIIDVEATLYATGK